MGNQKALKAAAFTALGVLCLVAALALGASPAYADNLSEAKQKYGVSDNAVVTASSASAIPQAIERAKALAGSKNALVNIPAGTYRMTQKLDIPKNVVVCAAANAKFVAAANITQFFTVSGVMYGGVFDGAGKAYYCLRFADGNLGAQGVIEKTTATNSKRAGIMANGTSRGGKVLKCTVRKCGNTGISAAEGGKLDLVDACTVENNTRSGVNISGGSSITTVSNCSIRNNEGHGISTDSTDKRSKACTIGTVKGCTINGNGTNGIWVDSYCNVGKIEKCTVNANKVAGISVSHHAKTTIEGCAVSSNGKSNVRGAGTSCVITMTNSNTISKNSANNITLDERATLNITGSGNVVSNAGAAGVSVKSGCTLNVTGSGNKFTNNGSYGVRVEAGGSISIKDSDLTGNKSGWAAYVYEGARFSHTNCNLFTDDEVHYYTTGAPKIKENPIKATAHWKRLYGSIALDTMESIGKEGFGKSNVVVIATSSGFYDALAASALAGKHRAPVLLTKKDTLSAQTAREIKRLGATTAYIAGGTAAISTKTEGQIRAALAGSKTVKRLAGNIAVETAEKIAAEVGGNDTCIIATSRSFHDALAASPFAYARQAPIFLTRASGELTASTQKAIKAAGFKRAIIVGGTGVIPGSTEGLLKGLGIGTVERKGGKNAYQTAAFIARWCISSEQMTANSMGVATGTGYWDALTGAALCGSRNAVLILADENKYYGIDQVIKPYANQIKRGYIFGGSAAVPNVVMTTCENAVASGSAAGKNVQASKNPEITSNATI